jgi:CheY-like chemotaxis protein
LRQNLSGIDPVRTGWRVLPSVGDDSPGDLQRARPPNHDIAFVDIGLPELDGLEVARVLRRDRSTAGLPLIAMSGYGRDEDKRRSVSAGFDAHLVKPVDAEQLVEVARDVLERRLPGAKAEGAPELSAPVRPE